ncbi:hypothetical protein AAVH_17223, partial [Aphelenchoides avenae]
KQPDEKRDVKNSSSAKTLRDVLPKETIVDVFDFSTREDLDDWTTVSRKFHKSTQNAQPLRRVHRVTLTCREVTCPSHFIKRKQYEAVFYLKGTDEPQDGRVAKNFIEPDVISICTPFFSCLRFCCVKTGVIVRSFPIDRAFVDDLKAINKDFHTEVGFPACEWYNVSFAEDVDPYDAITSFPSFRRIAFSTLASLVKHFGGPNDALLCSLAVHGVWCVRIPDEKVVPHVGESRITEDGVLDFAFGDYEDDEEGRRLETFPEVALTPQFFEKLEKASEAGPSDQSKIACRNCKSIHKTEVVIRTHRAFDIAEWNSKIIARLNNYL